MRSDTQRMSTAPTTQGGQNAEEVKEARNLEKSKDTLLNRLAEHVPGVSAEDMRKQKAEDFTPEKVAGRIAGYVGLGLANARAEGRSEADIEKMHAAAMRGIEKGFNEAKDILKELDILGQGNIEKTIDETFDKTMDAVKALLPSNDNLPSAPARASEAFYAEERYAKAETFSLSLKTKEGDDVVIEFASAQQQSSSVAAARSGGNSAAAASLERSSASSMNFSIQGDLNEEEVSAINDLLRDVNDIADEFFGGDIQAAFDKATEFEMDGSQLASMNLRLTRSESHSATSAYSSVGNMVPAMEALEPLNDLSSKLNTLSEDPRNSFMDATGSLIASIVDSLIPQDSRYQNADDKGRELLDRNLQQMNSMMDALFDRGNTEAEPAAVEAPVSAAI